MTTQVEEQDAKRTNNERFYTAMYEQAWNFYEAGRDTESFALCNKLLLMPSLGDLYASGLHMLLSYGPDQKLVHARQSLSLAEHMYDHLVDLTNKHKTNQLKLIQQAKDRIAQVEQEVKEKPRYTDADIDRDFEILTDNLEQMERDQEEEQERRERAEWTSDDDDKEDAENDGGRGGPPLGRMRALSIEKQGSPRSQPQRGPAHRRVSSLNESMGTPRQSQTPPTSQDTPRRSSSGQKPGYDHRRTPSVE